MEKLIKYLKTTFELENMYFSPQEIINIINNQERKKEMTKENTINYQKWEDYFIEGTDVLKNKQNIQNKEELSNYERMMSAQRLVELYNDSTESEYDFKHLCEIHEYLFQDTYDWAGEIRTVPMMKQTAFLNPEYIKDYINTVLMEMKKNINEIHNEFELASHLSNLFYCLIYAHPFREGNGRTIREFIRQFVNSLDFEFGSYDIDYSIINKSNIALGVTTGAIMFITPEFQKALITKEKEKDVTQYLKKVL